MFATWGEEKNKKKGKTQKKLEESVLSYERCMDLSCRMSAAWGIAVLCVMMLCNAVRLLCVCHMMCNFAYKSCSSHNRSSGCKWPVIATDAFMRRPCLDICIDVVAVDVALLACVIDLFF